VLRIAIRKRFARRHARARAGSAGMSRAVTPEKLGPTQFQAEIERLKSEGHMPSLEQLLEAVAESRQLYAKKILVARSGLKIVRRKQ
jgi:hypothetical protein